MCDNNICLYTKMEREIERDFHISINFISGCMLGKHSYIGLSGIPNVILITSQQMCYFSINVNVST